MRLSIDNGQQDQSIIFKDEGDLALVLLHQPAKVDELYKRIAHLMPRINGIYIVCQTAEKYPLAQMRKSWIRVQRELAIFGQQVKRILVMGNTTLLRVVIPQLGKAGDLQSAHGTLFKVDGIEYVPTWQQEDYALLHSRAWHDRDMLRFEKLTRPLVPLTYTIDIPDFNNVDTVVIDLESAGPKYDTITTMGIQWSDEDRALYTDTHQIQLVINRICNSNVKHVILHNAAFDLSLFTKQQRFELYGRVRDTMLMARARGELVAGLKHLAVTYTARPGNYAWIDRSHDFDDPAYVCEDIETTWRLFKLWRTEIDRPVVELMNRAVVMCVNQTEAGTAINTEVLPVLAEEGARHVAELRVELTERYGVDPGQQTELCEVLKSMGHVLTRKTKKGEDQLTAEVLEELGLEDILEFRKAMKLDSAFVGKISALIRENGTIPHVQSLLNARTGRTTMRDFNHQQMPKKGPGKKIIRSRWKGGKVLNCDLKTAEVVVAAWVSEDEKLAAACMLKDMHRANAARGFQVAEEVIDEDQRFAAKALIFRSIFGGKPQNELQERVYKYMVSEFSALFRWVEYQKKLGQRSNSVTDAWGKVINLLDILDYKSKWAAGRVGINGPIQGCSSHVAIAITVRVWELFWQYSLNSLVLFGVHDSFLADIYPGEETIAVELIDRAFKDLHTMVPVQLRKMLRILPMRGEIQIADTWAECKTAEVIMVTSHMEII